MDETRSVHLAKRRGHQAYRKGRPVWANPYLGGEAEWWRKGWLAAKSGKPMSGPEPSPIRQPGQQGGRMTEGITVVVR